MHNLAWVRRGSNQTGENFKYEFMGRPFHWGILHIPVHCTVLKQFVTQAERFLYQVNIFLTFDTVIPGTKFLCNFRTVSLKTSLKRQRKQKLNPRLQKHRRKLHHHQPRTLVLLMLQRMLPKKVDEITSPIKNVMQLH